MNHRWNRVFEIVVDGSIRNCRSVSGGCIHEAFWVTTDDGRDFFVKTNANAPAEMFAREAEGLKAIAATAAIRVPEVIGFEEPSGNVLILEAIATGHTNRRFFESFGRQLARMHRAGSAAQFGFDSDNFLGNTPQPNRPSGCWVEFWRERRLGYQLDLARTNGHGNAELFRRGETLLRRLDQILATADERPALLHGDLWSGNFLASLDGEPILIDPAVYYGSREAEFGMTLLFGGFDSVFYDAYQEEWPLQDGYLERFEIYKLYHLLNHLNLFGSSYLDGCLSVLRQFT